MRFKQIHTDEELYDGIWMAFYMDSDLIHKYHILENCSFEDCVLDTFKNIKECVEKTDCECFQILYDEELIGFFAISRAYSFLYSFGVNVNYRTSQILEMWFGYVSVLLGSEFTCSLWAKNSRAIDFLKKQGMRLYESTDSIVVYKYN